MSPTSIVREAAQALRFNRQRSVLTTISLAWGVACFVILYAYGDGFHLALQVAFRQVGQDLVLMFGGQTSKQAGGERAGRRIRLETADVDAVRDTVPLVAAISPEMMMGGMTITRGYRTRGTMVRAVRAPYGRIRNMTMARGRWLGPEDDTEKRRVAVLGAEAAEKLFGEIPPLDEEIAINGVRFVVVGVLKTKTQIANYNTPDNECVFVPFDSASMFRNLRYPDDVVWMPANPVFREDAVRQVRATMARLHNFHPADERALRTFVFNESMRLVDTMGVALRVLLGFIGALTLAIGGVGLANIMLVSVTQRTREIGVLKSIGATRRSILAQFLLEAMAIVTLGGVLGIAAGWGFTALLGSLPLLGPLFHETGGAGDVQLRISGFAVAASTLILESVGLVAGLLPAIRAARLDPIEALRYE
ncbi:MAG: ABC transporter permease [Acidobacteria bacterium]|nr:ABC transporter permease [Acidobacteriota bacterium]